MEVFACSSDSGDGLPKRLLDNCPDQFELTGVGASLETAVAMGAIAQRLADL